jgi:hypothetical protein
LNISAWQFVTFYTIVFTFMPFTPKNYVNFVSISTRFASKVIGVKSGLGVITSVATFLVKDEGGKDVRTKPNLIASS